MPPSSSRGGIFADDMGLGKTLTILTAIVKTLDHSMAFAKGQTELLSKDEMRCKATLVVVPSFGKKFLDRELRKAVCYWKASYEALAPKRIPFQLSIG